MNRCRFARSAVCLLSLLCTACANDSAGFKPTQPLRGQVFFEDQPAVGASVVLHPLDGPDPRVRPSGKVDKDGWYTLSTYRLNDGAPMGNYAVTIVWLPEGSRGGGPDKPPDKLGGRYEDPESSGLSVRIDKDTTELPVFRLSK
jgi:hypothetical protein